MFSFWFELVLLCPTPIVKDLSSALGYKTLHNNNNTSNDQRLENMRLMCFVAL